MTISVFFSQIPNEIFIDRNWTCRPNEPENAWKRPYLVQPATVESVQEALARGPFIAQAKIGPSCYRDQPTSFDGQITQRPDIRVYGWPAGSKRVAGENVPVIICGTQRREGQEHIYYRLAEDVSDDPDTAIGTIRPSTDKKVYVSSMRTFAEYEFDMFPPVSQEELEQKENEKKAPATFLAGRPDLIKLLEKGKISIAHS